ncbi:glycosyltransferase [Metabacillus indicus]|uniref:Glycosyltransferase 2-like domain-containing protein n=1 Tax=Metabacillus indicus TaxID=246786 RepID=A0A084H4H3_METID|nr:glycosyltransferase [Metabacillus indicus]KEZ50329.1 hypothetical protein AZ46_0206485 [Metabacillus indicus LMG 22858]KEZ54485.1 hypothetical protein GS18_0206160 [Metabacillus indicus]
MSLKISVIIPVYNAEKYLEACIESLLNQTLKECEFIFVNDGSTDRSRKIIEEKLKTSKQIKLINQKNNGVSSARNNGLEIAKGEYVGFVDADDFIEEEFYETLYKQAIINQSDIIISNYISYRKGEEKVICNPLKLDTIYQKKDILNEILPYLIESDQLNSIWNKVYKRDIIQHNNILFPNNLSLGEDGIFNILYLNHANSLKYINYSGYYYRNVEGSATRNIITKDYFKRELDIYNNVLVNELNIDKKTIKLLKSKKLVRNSISLIHEYFSPNNKMNLYKRYRFVKKIIRNTDFIDALSQYLLIYSNELNRYEKLLIFAIKYKLISGLNFLVLYSYYKNNKRC